MGTPEFSVPSLRALIDRGHDIVGVFTKPDRKKGRGQKIVFSPVKEEAIKHGIEIFQPENLKSEDVLDTLERLNPEVIIVVAYGKILPEKVLRFPKNGCINLHASLLPKYRGAAPIQWAVISGEKTTGVTIMYMEKGLDTGDMLLKVKTDIDPEETAGELSLRLSRLGSNVLLETMENLQNGTLVRVKQDDTLATYARMLTKDDALLDFSMSARNVHNHIRGIAPYLTAYCTLFEKNVKIHKIKVLANIIGSPGEVKSTRPLVVCCGEDSAIEILELQVEGKKRMSTEDFLRGLRQ